MASSSSAGINFIEESYSSDALSNYEWSSGNEEVKDSLLHSDENIFLIENRQVIESKGGAEKEEILEPEIKMSFDSEEEAYVFYNRYALANGFSIKWYRTRNKNGTFFRTICCSKEGFKAKKEYGEEARNPRKNTRTGCLASIGIQKKNDGPWILTKFIKEHNHELLLPGQSFTLRSHRKGTKKWGKVITELEKSGIRPRFAFQYMSFKSGGMKNLGFLPQDHLNFIHSKRRESMEKGDVAVILKYLEDKQKQDRAFRYEMQYDEDYKITNVFWADGRAIMDFSFFGDVVCFDTTYKTNKYGRPLGIFAGIDNHRRTIIFGVVLLFDETISSFNWLFSNFVRIMGREPKTFLTDQDKAMATAIKDVLPNTKHRICIWHMYQNACKHLSHVFNQIIDGRRPFKKDFSRCIYLFQDEIEFKEAWDDMIAKYKLGDNEWLQKLFNEKEKWALVYGRQVFCGGMHSTQRSESLNRRVKAYLNSSQNLFQFFHHYDMLVAQQRYKQFLLDCTVSNINIDPIIPSPLLKELANIYTHAAYRMVQDEYVYMCNCRILDKKEVGILKEYSLGELSGRKISTAVFDPSNFDISCTCKTFEFRGHLCRHIFVVFQNEGVMKTPPKYILSRWRKDARDKAAIDYWDDHGLDQDTIKVRRSNNLYSAFLKISEDVVQYDETYRMALSSLEALSINMSAWKKKMDGIPTINNVSDNKETHMCENKEVDEDDQNISPFFTGFKKKTREKGRHRIKGSLEKGKRRKINAKQKEPSEEAQEHNGEGISYAQSTPTNLEGCIYKENSNPISLSGDAEEKSGDGNVAAITFMDLLVGIQNSGNLNSSTHDDQA